MTEGETWQPQRWHELEQFSLTFAFFVDPEGHLVGLSKGAVQ